MGIRRVWKRICAYMDKLALFLVGLMLGGSAMFFFPPTESTLTRKAYAAGYSDAYAEGLTCGIQACKE